MEIRTPFDFFEQHDAGESAAIISFNLKHQELVGSFRQMNLLKQFGAYSFHSGVASVLDSFIYFSVTEHSRQERTVDMTKRMSDYVMDGRKAEDLAYHLGLITQVRNSRFRTQAFPKSGTIQSMPINKLEAKTIGGGDYMRGLTMMVGSDSFVRPILESETYENNKTFFELLRNAAKNGFDFKKTRFDGAPDGEDIHVAFDDRLRYETKNEGFISVEDLVNLRAVMENNMLSVPGLSLAPRTILISPNTAAAMIQNNKDKDNILHYAMFANMGTDKSVPPTAYGFSFAVHPMAQDNEAFVLSPGNTIKVYDWGTETVHVDEPYMPNVSTIQRTSNYDAKVVQPLSMMHISIKGKTDDYDGDRWDKLRTTTDEPFKPIRAAA